MVETSREHGVNVFILIATSGEIEVTSAQYFNSMAHSWYVDSACDEVTVYSSVFDTEKKWDYLTLNGKKYHGIDKKINQKVPGDFIVHFDTDNSVSGSDYDDDYDYTSYSYDGEDYSYHDHQGFKLHWSCSNMD